MTDAEKINDLCQRTTKPNTLNAIHACRDNHPLGRDNARKWRNAMAMVVQSGTDFSGSDLRWLEDRAREEQIAAIAQSSN